MKDRPLGTVRVLKEDDLLPADALSDKERNTVDSMWMPCGEEGEGGVGAHARAHFLAALDTVADAGVGALEGVAEVLRNEGVDDRVNARLAVRLQTTC